MTVDEKPTNAVRRNVRPSFADDVYGQSSNTSNASNTPTTNVQTSKSTTTIMSPSQQHIKPKSEICESSLAQRRAANLPKLKELAPEIKPSIDYSQKSEMSEIDFPYGDTDTYENELAELYSYSEMEDWAIGLETFNKYVDNRNISQIWKEIELTEKKKLISDLIQMLENTESSIRLESARLILYLLQGAYGDFKTIEDDDVNIDKLNFNTDKGTGGKEHECLISGGINAYMIYEQGVYQALCSMLLFEIQEPFDVNYCAERSRSRQSSVSNSSRSASNIDLADSVGSLDRRNKKSATLADNENIRIVLNCLYHFIEAIRREDWLEELSEISHYNVEELMKLRKRFLTELDEPLESCKIPLLIVLFDMMPTFAKGINPHYPMKKVLILIWKILLSTLGGFEKLKEEKNILRKELELPPIDDTIEIASQMKAVRINCDGGVVSYRDKMMNAPRYQMSRQMACLSGDPPDLSTTSPKEENELPPDTPITRPRGRGSSDDESGNDGLPGVEGDDEVIDDKPIPNAKAEDSSPPIDNQTMVSTPTPTVTVNQPRFAGNIAFQEFHGRGDLTPKAGSPKKISLPWAPKVKESQIEQFLQQARLKYFGYEIPDDTTTTFNLPKPVESSIKILRKHVYKSLNEIQIDDDIKYNRYPFTQKEEIKNSPVERLYTLLLPSMGDYLVALLKILLASLPSSKSRGGDALSILSDVLTPETDNNEMLSNSINLDSSTRNVLEEHVRVAIDIARHKEIMIKSISGILILLFKWLKLNHIYQYESVGQHMIVLNCVPLMLKFLDQNMVKYIQAKNEILPYNYPIAPIYFARNREEWPTLSADNVDNSNQNSQSYYIWRNVYSSINIVRLLNKIVKNKQPRAMMLVVFKSAPILKRCLRVKCIIFQLYCLKLLKSQCRFLGRQWRKSNMDVMSAIYSRVRHRLNDDWAYANDIRNKQWDFQSEENYLKIAVEKFHSRRYSNLYPQFKINTTETTNDSTDYFDRTSLSDFEPVDTCIQSVLKFEPIYSDVFKKNYEKWLENEIYNNEIDWDKLLDATKGFAGKLLNKKESKGAENSSINHPETRNRISTVVSRDNSNNV